MSFSQLIFGKFFRDSSVFIKSIGIQEMSIWEWVVLQKLPQLSDTHFSRGTE